MNDLEMILELVKAAKAEEREECAKIADSFRRPGFHIPQTIAEMIRKRGLLTSVSV